MRTGLGFCIAVLLCAALLAASAQVTAQNPPPVSAEDLARLKTECEAKKFDSCTTLGRKFNEGASGLRLDVGLAAQFFRQACDGGFAEGCGQLGGMYEYGRGSAREVVQDVGLAAKLFKQSCDGGFFEGCTRLGAMYEEGRGFAKDFARAIQLYKQACDGGYGGGCTRLGAMYGMGQGVTQDVDRAFALYEAGCRAKDRNGCSHMGQMVWRVKEPARQIELLELACDGNDADTCVALAEKYENGRGVTADPARALTLYKRACEKGLPRGCESAKRATASVGLSADLARLKTECQAKKYESCNQLGMKYQEGIPGLLQGDRALGIRFYEQACMGEVAAACSTLGKLCNWGEQNACTSLQQAAAGSLDRLKTECAARKYESCNAVGVKYYQGFGGLLRPDYNQPVQYFQQACEGGYAAGCSLLGEMYEFGRGVTQDLERAVTLYRSACKAKVDQGCAALGSVAEIKLKDPARQIVLLQEACDGNNTIACRNLGVRYQYGKGVAADMPRALALYNRACEMHDKYGCDQAVDQQAMIERERLRGLCDQKDFKSCMELGSKLEQKRGSEPAQFTPVYQKACDEGHLPACHRLASVYGQTWNGVPPDAVRAVALFKLACDGSYAESCSELARYYKNGWGGLTQDFNKAIALFKQACTMNYAQACQQVEQAQKEAEARATMAAVATTSSSSAGAAPPAAVTGSIMVTASPDRRGLSFNPPGRVLAFPAGIMVKHLEGSAGYAQVGYEVSGRSYYVELSFPNYNCDEWKQKFPANGDHGKSKSNILAAGTRLYDPRWSSTYFTTNNGGRVFTCLDRPGGAVRAELTTLGGWPEETVYQLTSGIADLFRPETIAAKAPAPTQPPAPSGTSVQNVYPQSVVSAAERCKSGQSQVACQAVQMFSQLQGQCIGGSSRSCSGIADLAASMRDARAAAIYYQRACELGDSGSCKKAAENRKKAGM